jgi:hypothetical protein
MLEQLAEGFDLVDPARLDGFAVARRRGACSGFTGVARHGLPRFS